MNLLSCNFTGHRPQDLGGYDERDPLNIWVKQSLIKSIIGLHKKYGTREWITGLALGVDQWAAEIIIWLKNEGYDFYLVGMKPFTSQHIKWNDRAQDRFFKICDLCDELVVCQPDPYAAWKMDARNKAMVNRSDFTLAVWSGKDGGTGNCVKYARSRKKPIFRIDPTTKRIGWEDKD